MQHFHLFHHPLAQAVHLRQLLLIPFHSGCLPGKKTAVAAVSSNAGLQTVVFQSVRLLPVQIRQTAAQVVKHSFIGEIFCVQLQGALDILNHGIQHNPPGPVKVKGNLHLGKL